MRILVTDGMDKTAMAQLREQGHEVVEQFYEPDQLGAALRDFDVAVVRSKTKVRKEHIDAAKGGKLKMIIRGGVGVDNIDVKYAEENGITVKNTPRASSQSVAELAMGHMFACARYLSIAGHTMREGKWEKKAYGKGIELQGKTLGIVGFGRIGQHLGVMAKAIGMKVIAFDIYQVPVISEQLGIPYVEMDELLAQSDFISVHAPAVDGGALISAENIAKMKDGVVVINTSRGTNVDEAALLREALPEYDGTWAQNYDSPFLMYPLRHPHGASASGLMTLSALTVDSARRVELPIENSLMKLVDLDRCYSVHRIPVAGGGELVLYNLHLSAYTSDGTIAMEQLKLLLEDMQREYDAGNWCVAGGDFNKDLLGDSAVYFGEADQEYTWAQPIPEDTFDGFNVSLIAPLDEGNPVPSCRNADGPYHQGQYVLTVDGFLVSDNVTVTSSDVVDLGFAYSDHNPVEMRFVLE